MDREFELRNLSDFELLLLLLAFLSNDVGECVDQSSLESLFIHLSGQQGGSDTDVVTYVVTSHHDYVRNVLWINKYEHAFKMAW